MFLCLCLWVCVMCMCRIDEEFNDLKYERERERNDMNSSLSLSVFPILASERPGTRMTSEKSPRPRVAFRKIFQQSHALGSRDLGVAYVTLKL